MRFHYTLLILAVSVLPCLSIADDAIPPAQLDYFEKHVRPALIKYCYECHSAEAGESRGGLHLDTRESMREGGSTGPLFDDEEWEYSLFVDAITWADSDYEMPPKSKMPEDVIDHLLEWVKMGAPDPRERKTYEVESKIDIEAGKDHWSYQSPVRSQLSSLDEIIAKKQQAEGVEPVGKADSLSLLRRLTFDLTGLPPSPSESGAFYRAAEKDRSAAIQQKVDELLASDRFGERWGRHWLDVVRYGESAGTMNVTYPYAWRFRDYVIDSFNNDKPYDQLITEHLAGDLLPGKSTKQRQENLIATGYLAVGPKKQNEKNRQVFQMNLIDEQIDTTTRGFIATTVACARCHDHKFDPISTGDYYAMAGIFKSSETLWGTIAGNQNHRTSGLQSLPIPDAGTANGNQSNLYEEKQKQLSDLIKLNNSLRGREGGKGKGKGKGKGGPGEVDLDKLAEMGMDRAALVKVRQRILRTRSELEFLNPDGSAKTFGMGAREGEISQCNILVSGDINKPAQEVPRGFPEVLKFEGTPVIPSSASGRLELAQWITSTNNPLTARVMVNRIWLYLTGATIVETMDNFGTTGLPPSNPELLDFLAIRFMESGWSIKTLVREIVLSDTYQLATSYHAENHTKDPANTNHWRALPRQLDAEALRDQMLQVSGLLDLQRPKSLVHTYGDGRMMGRGVDITGGAFDTTNFRVRSVYLPILRDSLPDELGLFDFPDPQGTVSKRSATNVAPQSLHLMNSTLARSLVREMAESLEKNYSSQKDQISRAILLAYNRPATGEEVERGLQFLSVFDPGDPPPAPKPAASPSQGKGGKGKGTKGKGKGTKGGKGGKGGKGKGGNSTPAATPAKPEPPMTESQMKLAAFCQALMMTAEFRTIH